MEKVGLVPAESLAMNYPADLSGGQRQRAVIARAMILGPDFVVADEPVSMLDMSIRARVLKLLLDLKDEFGLTYLFITHDLATAKFMCDRVGILYLGQLVEVVEAGAVFEKALHPYTKALMRAVPVPDPRKAGDKPLPKGEIPDAVTPPAGCRFHPRCPEALPECGWEPRDLQDLLNRHVLELAEDAAPGARSGAPAGDVATPQGGGAHGRGRASRGSKRPAARPSSSWRPRRTRPPGPHHPQPPRHEAPARRRARPGHSPGQGHRGRRRGGEDYRGALPALRRRARPPGRRPPGQVPPREYSGLGAAPYPHKDSSAPDGM